MHTLLSRVLSGAFGALILLPAAALAVPATLAPTLELRQMGDLMVPFQSGLPLPTYEPQSRPKMELSEGWRLLRVSMSSELSLSARTPETLAALEKEGKGAHRPEFDDSKWASTSLPAVANPPPKPGATGVWYRRKITIPAQWKGRRILLHCLAANYVADVWVNGRHTGYHEGGFTPFTFDLTDFLHGEGAEVLAIRVDNPPWRTEGGSFQQSLLPPGPGDWWNATGVLRDIYLEAVPAVSIVRVDVRAEPQSEGSKVRTAVVLRNAGGTNFAGRLELHIFPTRVTDANLTNLQTDALMLLHEAVEVRQGNEQSEISIASKSVNAWSDTLETETLSEWSPDDPNLYVLEATLRTGEGQVVDRVTTQFGVRTWSVDSKSARLLLNDRATLLAGVDLMDDDLQQGPARSYRDGLRTLLDLRSVKDIGGNFLRLVPGVPHPAVPLLADRLGLVCWEEIPAYALAPEAMQIQWEQRRIARQMFLEMLYQDFNRPSVAFWGTGSRLGPGAVHRDFVRDLADMSRFLDGTRLVAESALLDDHSPEQTEGDVLGYAFDIAMGGNAEALMNAMAVLDQRHRTQPKKPVIITEFGARAGRNQEVYDRQMVDVDDTIKVLSARPWVAGCTWWTLADYQGAEGVKDTGLFTRDRHTAREARQEIEDQFLNFLSGANPMDTTLRSQPAPLAR